MTVAECTCIILTSILSACGGQAGGMGCTGAKRHLDGQVGLRAEPKTHREQLGSILLPLGLLSESMSSCVHICAHFFLMFLFIFETETEHEQGRGRERGRHRM